MQVKIRFLGILSVKYGAEPVLIEIGPESAALETAIQGLLNKDGSSAIVILKNGRPFQSAGPVCDGDEFCVFSPISGG